MMLRKSTSSHQKDQNMVHLMSEPSQGSCFHSDNSGKKHATNSFLNVPGLFLGLNRKGSDSDSVRSPTSTLDFRVFSSFGSPFRSPRSTGGCQRKSWECSKVGLSLVDSLGAKTEHFGKVLQSSDSKNVLGPRMRIGSLNVQSHDDFLFSPKSLPKNVSSSQGILSNLQKRNPDVLFGAQSGQKLLENFRSCSLDSARSDSPLKSFIYGKPKPWSEKLSSETNCGRMSSTPGLIGSETALYGSIPTSEIEHSEDYTCVRTHGLNAKVTHIFNDCVLECHEDELTTYIKGSKEDIASTQVAECSQALVPSYPFSDFLKFCHSCKKNLDGEDIYMYRGEKAFCSCDCRLEEILRDEKLERTNKNASECTDMSNSYKETGGSSFFITANDPVIA